MDRNTGEIINYRHDPENPNSLSNNACYNIIEESGGVYLISTQHGFNRLDARNINNEGDKWEVFLPIPGDAASISSDYVFGAIQDSKDEFWVFLLPCHSSA